MRLAGGGRCSPQSFASIGHGWMGDAALRQTFVVCPLMGMPSSAQWFVAMGASGREGLDDIKAVLSALGPHPNAVVMVVLHRPFEEPSHLREILSRSASMPVRIADDGDRPQVGCCFIGEPAGHLTLLARGDFGITDDPHRLSRNRTVDLLLESLAKGAAPKVIGIVLSGSLDDGSRGLAAIHHGGGKTMVIGRESRHPGMPENAIGYDGPIDRIGSANEIAAAIHDLVGSEPGRQGLPAIAGPSG